MKEKYLELDGDYKEFVTLILDGSSDLKENLSYNLQRFFHITTLFLGRKNSPNYGNLVNTYFSLRNKIENSSEIQFKFLGFVMITKKIFTCLVATEEKCQNKIPHITIYSSKEYSPKDSNVILNELFGENKVLEKEYEDIVNSKTTEFIDKIQTKIKEKDEIIYVYLFNNDSNFSGVLKEFFY